MGCTHIGVNVHIGMQYLLNVVSVVLILARI